MSKEAAKIDSRPERECRRGLELCRALLGFCISLCALAVLGFPAVGLADPRSRTVDLLRWQSARSEGTVPSAMPTKAGREIKYAVPLDLDRPIRLGPIEAEPGGEVRFEFTRFAEKPEDARLQLVLHDGPPGADSRARVLLDRPIQSESNAGIHRYSPAVVALPRDLSGPVTIEIVARPENEPASSRAAFAIADLVLLPAEGSLPIERMNVLLVTLDTMRADHMSVYGYGRDTTPFLREFAGETQVYQQAYSPSTWTLPSHGSLFTGLFPSQHGAITADERLGGSPLVAERRTLAEVLNENGYLTMGVVAGPMLARNFGVDQGFAYYSDRWAGERRRARELNEHALRLLDRAGDRPFFLFLNYFDAHTPYDPDGYAGDDAALFTRHGIDPSTFHWRVMRAEGRKGLPKEVVDAMIDRYDAEIEVVDRALRALLTDLDARGLLERTLVCITSDHGESFGEHAIWGHGGPFYESQTRVPLIYRNPRAAPMNGIIKAPISTVELPARILKDLGLQGLSVPPGSPTVDAPRPIYGERFSSMGSMRMLREGSEKYLVRLMRRPEGLRRIEQFFDLSVDAGEKKDRARDDVSRLGELRRKFETLLVEMSVAPTDWAVGPRDDEEPVEASTSEEDALEQQLRALGYVE